MQPEEFLRQAELLTGTEIKGEAEIDKTGLAATLADDARPIDCSQFNELLLLVHKDRVESPFFEHFFGAVCAIGDIPKGVEKFQRAAMLLYGNFVFAYRRLSRIRDAGDFRRKLGELAADPAADLARFRNRKPKLLEIDRISREQTPYVGYLSSRRIRAERERCGLMSVALEGVGTSADWEAYLQELASLASVEEFPVLQEIAQIYRALSPGSTLVEWARFSQESLAWLSRLEAEAREVRRRAAQNQNTYLTWDHMDVYFATSMRRAWEYEDLYDFIEQLMSSPELAELNIRYFDPTQSYTDNRVNKGLLEALMLKRARCTVYCVQDTDTLGKDSELASTLAQGKPVIVYVPDLSAEERTPQLMAEDPVTILERLRFVLYADEHLSERLSNDDCTLLDRVQDQLEAFASARIWRSLPDDTEAAKLKTRLASDLDAFCRIIAGSEKAVYDSRASTLRESHPLAIQVNLDSGVANGVLVVRTVPKCAELLRRILVYDMEFELEEKDRMWYLREKISGCIYRVVTNDTKLNNSFWNFYLRDWRRNRLPCHPM